MQRYAAYTECEEVICMPLSREKMREYMRARRAANPEWAKERGRKDYESFKARAAVDPSLLERRREAQRRYVESHREELVEQARLRYARIREIPVAVEELRARNRDGQLRYRGAPKNRQKVVARWLAGKALQRGKLKRRPCQVCGDERSQMHHPDYSEPYRIEWLCRKHHAEKHRKPVVPV